MGGKASKNTPDQGLVPRDGSDEIEIPTRKLVTQEQFDELIHKFTVLEQLMNRDKSKLTSLETSVNEYQQDRHQLRQSFVEIDSEVRRDKEQRERTESNIADVLEQRTREKYQLLDQMLNSQTERIDQLIREQNDKSQKLNNEFGQLNQRLTTSLQTERNEVERFVETRISEGGRQEGKLENRLSKFIDESSLSVTTVHQQLEDRRRETQEVRDSIEREKDALMQEIARVQNVMMESKQTKDAESSLSAQLSATKEQLELKLSEEERARLQLETILKTMLDNKVSENQKQFYEKIQAQEQRIQDQLIRMEQLRESVDRDVKEEQNKVLQTVETRISEMSNTYDQQLTAKENEKTEITRKLSQDFESRLQTVQHTFTSDIQLQKNRTESILEESDNEKKTLQQKLDALEENVNLKLQDAQTEIAANSDKSIAVVQANLDSLSKLTNENIQLSSNEVSGVKQQLSEAESQLTNLREAQISLKEDIDILQNSVSNDLDAKIQLIIEAKLLSVSTEFDTRISQNAKFCSEISEKIDSIGTSHEPKLDSSGIEEYRQKTSEDIGTLMDTMEERSSELQSVAEKMIEIDLEQKTCLKSIQSNEGQLQTAQSDLLILRADNSALNEKVERQTSELAVAADASFKLQQSVDAALRKIDEQNEIIIQLKNDVTTNRQSVTEIPPESPLEKMEEMETKLKKQGHGINDLEFLIDQAKETAKTSEDNVDSAIYKFESKLDDETAQLRSELEALKTELTNKIAEMSANQKPAASNPFEDAQ